MTEKISYLADMDKIEPHCIAMRIRSTIIFAYPFTKEVAETGAKIVTRDGRTVKNVKPFKQGDANLVIGELDGERITWDENGRYSMDGSDSDNDLYIFERYFMKDWKSHIKMSHGEFALRFQRPHPAVEIPDRNNSRPWGK